LSARPKQSAADLSHEPSKSSILESARTVKRGHLKLRLADGSFVTWTNSPANAGPLIFFVSFVFFVVSQAFHKTDENHKGHEGHKEVRSRPRDLPGSLA
jgi:hypothetical protein